MTKVARTRVPDEVYELARRHFGEKELVDLPLVVVATKSWNRMAISFRKVQGTY
jgi:alkylhydroperoxidase family enzyme